MGPNVVATWSAELELVGAGGEPVDLGRTLLSHGFVELPPMRIDEDVPALEVTLLADRRTARTIDIRAGRKGHARMSVLGRAPSQQLAGKLLDRARHVLALDEDLSAFYELVSSDADLAWARAGAGRLVRSPTVFEDVIKTICTTNTVWSATTKMVTALVTNLGAAAPGGRHAFPTPEVMAGQVADHEGLGFTLGLPPPEEMHPLTVRDRLQTSWVGFLQELTSERPAAVLVEDLHWAGDELCDLLQMLAERVAGPALLVVTARPELFDQRPGWPAGGLLLRLGALPAVEAEQLAGALLGSDCPAPIRELVAERAEGNPFFVEELIATLASRGVLARRNGGWSFGELPARASTC